jgi:hypothetical protein
LQVLAVKDLQAIGDLKYEADIRRIDAGLKKALRDRNQRIQFDRADMTSKVHSYSLWQADATVRANGGFGGQDPNTPHMLTPGESNTMSAGRVGELKQAAHWAFANQKAAHYAAWEKMRKKLTAEKTKVTQQHDLTLCRTGRKPENPQTKYELAQAKLSLQRQLDKMPDKKSRGVETAKAQQEEATTKLKELEGKEKELEGAPKPVAAPAGGEENDLGESESIDSGRHSAGLRVGEAAVEFHKLVDASGGTETLAERVKMFKDLVESEQLEQQNIVRRNVELGEPNAV